MIRCGVNWTSPKDLALIRQLGAIRKIEFCEILLDNFLHLSPLQVADALGMPVAFHIMRSRFLERESVELRSLARCIRAWIDALNPLYVSDHIARFTVDGRNLPLTTELDYDGALTHATERVNLWHDLLETRVEFENFPSVFDEEGRQPGFFRALTRDTGCGLLFDCSNAVVASKNCGVQTDRWIDIATAARHLHIAGFRESDTIPSLAIDSHDADIADEAIAVLQGVMSHTSRGSDARTVVVERDANISVGAWQRDLRTVRAAVQEFA